MGLRYQLTRVEELKDIVVMWHIRTLSTDSLLYHKRQMATSALKVATSSATRIEVQQC